MVPLPVKRNKRAVEGELEHEHHLISERERRKKMKNMFHDLGDMIPQLPPRADKVRIIDEAVAYIRKMQEVLHNLEKKKLEEGEKQKMIKSESESESRMMNCAATVGLKTWASPNVVLTVAGNEAHLSIYYPRTNPYPYPKPQLLTVVCFLLHKYNLYPLFANINTTVWGRMLFFHLQAIGVPDHFPAESLLLVEEIYKQAASDIVAWISA
ncbi:transcription factor bHLH95-like [Andrographis paniculata]|uniref:transcription factor bHLH95-like n=1 Tax=Andrographis paniculata TaxID=175694 RepID=UPI0021E7137D|nr:transcription factor bHLH95-like [Andrographis paniculata]